MRWIKRKSELERLEQQYTKLMRLSFELASQDREKSEAARMKADKLYSEIKALSRN